MDLDKIVFSVLFLLLLFYIGLFVVSAILHSIAWIFGLSTYNEKIKSKLNKADDVEKGEIEPKVVKTPSEDTIRVIARGNSDQGPYSIITWDGMSNVYKSHRMLEYEDEESAKKAAKLWSLGMEPLHHWAHKYVEHDHYHITSHYYVRFDNNPKVAVNMHFLFGPKIKEENFYSHRQRS